MSISPKYRACQTHCCPIHGCKYGDDYCPVYSGKIKPVYDQNNGCEQCDWDRENLISAGLKDLRGQTERKILANDSVIISGAEYLALKHQETFLLPQYKFALKVCHETLTRIGLPYTPQMQRKVDDAVKLLDKLLNKTGTG